MNMKAVILAGGFGTRISEESDLRPKPMIEIGGRPIIWHIMKTYSHYGINDFIICLGYKGYMIKEYFINYHSRMSDLTVDLQDSSIKTYNNTSEPWKVTLVNTGDDVMTGSRIKKIKDYLDDEDFCLTYGDGLSDINISDLIKFHKKQGKLATLTSIQPPGRFGALKLEENNVLEFCEKPSGEGSYVNGGFFVLSPKVLDYISQGDDISWEVGPLNKLADEGQLSSYKHDGFWYAMDTLRDKMHLEKLWSSSNVPWKIW